jgi:large subunit ribosomal protein L24
MQRFLARTTRAKRLKVNKNKESNKRTKQIRIKDLQAKRIGYRDQRKSMLSIAMKNAEEDWTLGPLAPRRDVGLDAESYGTVTDEILRKAPPVLPWQRPLATWGEMRNVYKVNDTAVIIRGTDKGMVGTIVETFISSQTAILKDLRMVYTLTTASRDYHADSYFV